MSDTGSSSSLGAESMGTESIGTESMGTESIGTAELSPVGLLAARLTSLCKEYSAALLHSAGELEKHCGKMAELRSRRPGSVDSAAKEMEVVKVIFGAAQCKILALQPAIDELARAVSQQLEFADLDFADKLELKLRLADLEAQLQAATTLASNLPPIVK